MNDAALTALVHDAEKASFGVSGVGPLSRMGDGSIKRFLRPRALLCNAGRAPPADPWWYPDEETQTTCCAALLAKFCSFLCGDFDNAAQVAAEAAGGGRRHPRASHVTRVCNDRIAGLPDAVRDGTAGVFILEESYYEHDEHREGTGAGKDAGVRKEVKPLLFFIEVRDNDGPELWLHSYAFPKAMYEGGPGPGKLNPAAAVALRNDSPSLAFAYDELRPSPTFPPARYEFDAAADAFTLCASVAYPGDVTFTLDETIAADGLRVMERLVKAGKQLTPYDTPIEYRRCG